MRIGIDSSRCNILKHAATCCNMLQHTHTYSNALDTIQHTAKQMRQMGSDGLCNRTLQHTATHCNTLQHTATHCNTLLRTAIHYSTLQQIQHTPSYMMRMEDDDSRCTILHHIPPHLKADDETGGRWLTLQHTATHCNAIDWFRLPFFHTKWRCSWRQFAFLFFRLGLVITLKSVTERSQLRLKFIRAILGQIALLLFSQPKTQNHSIYESITNYITCCI